MAAEEISSPPSWDPTVWDLARVGTRPWWGLDDIVLSGECVATRLVLTGDDAVDCIFVLGIRFWSKAPEGKDPLDWKEFADDEPDVFLRSLLFWPVLN